MSAPGSEDRSGVRTGGSVGARPGSMSAPGSEDRRAEAEVATPPRGVEVGPVEAGRRSRIWGAEPRPSARPPRGPTIGRALQVLALIVGLLGTAWISTDYFRTAWRELQPNQAVAVAQAGTATLVGITVSLAEVTDLGATPSLPGSDWQPPVGFHAWRIVLDSQSTNDDLIICDVALVDDQGRRFYAAYFVGFADGYEWSYRCGKPGPSDEVPRQQALLALVPADAEPVVVRIMASGLNPNYIELPLT